MSSLAEGEVAPEKGPTPQQRALQRWEDEGGEIPIVKVKRIKRKRRIPSTVLLLEE